MTCFGYNDEFSPFSFFPFKRISTEEYVSVHSSVFAVVVVVIVIVFSSFLFVVKPILWLVFHWFSFSFPRSMVIAKYNWLLPLLLLLLLLLIHSMYFARITRITRIPHSLSQYVILFFFSIVSRNFRANEIVL